MATEFEELKLQVTLVDNASAGLNRLRDEINKLSGQNVDSSMARFTRSLQGMNKATQQSTEAAGGFGTAVTRMYRELGSLGGNLHLIQNQMTSHMGGIIDYVRSLEQLGNIAYRSGGFSVAQLKLWADAVERIGGDRGQIAVMAENTRRNIYEIQRHNSELLQSIRQIMVRDPVGAEAVIRNLRANASKPAQFTLEMMQSVQNAYINARKSMTEAEAQQVKNHVREALKIPQDVQRAFEEGKLRVSTAEEDAKYAKQERDAREMQEIIRGINIEWKRIIDSIGSNIISEGSVFMTSLEKAAEWAPIVRVNLETAFTRLEKALAGVGSTPRPPAEEKPEADTRLQRKFRRGGGGGGVWQGTPLGTGAPQQFTGNAGTGEAGAFHPDVNFLRDEYEAIGGANIEDRRGEAFRLKDEQTGSMEALTSELKRLNDLLGLSEDQKQYFAPSGGGLRTGTGPGGGTPGTGGGYDPNIANTNPTESTQQDQTDAGTHTPISPAQLQNAKRQALGLPGAYTPVSPAQREAHRRAAATGQPVEGGSATENDLLAKERATLMSEINHDPKLRARIADILDHETHGDQKGAQAVMETMINRAMRLGHKSLWQTISPPNKDIEGSGFYGPVNRGELRGASRTALRIGDEAISRVAAGSNITDFRDDQGTNRRGLPEVPRGGSGITRIGDAGPGRGEHFYYSGDAAVSWANKIRERTRAGRATPATAAQQPPDGPGATRFSPQQLQRSRDLAAGVSQPRDDSQSPVRMTGGAAARGSRQSWANLSPEFKGRFSAMVQDMPEHLRDKLAIHSGWRSIATQAALAAGKSSAMVARPTPHAPHVRGDAADLTYADPEVRAWVHRHSGKYGLRFPMSYEPWHIQTDPNYKGPAYAGRKRTAQAAPVDRSAMSQTDTVNVNASGKISVKVGTSNRSKPPGRSSVLSNPAIQRDQQMTPAKTTNNERPSVAGAASRPETGGEE